MFPSTIDATPFLSPPDMEFTTLEIPEKKASAATPVRMIRNGLSPPFHDRTYTIKNAKMPPKQAAAGV